MSHYKTQLALPIRHRPQLGFDDFMVTATNQDAVIWLDRFPHWPNNGLVLYGPPGCGKTHLVTAFAKRTPQDDGQVCIIDASDTTAIAGCAENAATGLCVVVENADCPNVDATGLFHLFNALVAAGGFLLFTAQSQPRLWPIELPDLKSRLETLQHVAIRQPDDMLMAALLVKLFADRQLNVGSDVVGYLLRHMERSFDTARTVVDRADAKSLAASRKITVPLVRKVLEGLAFGHHNPSSANQFDLFG